jgi:hypothetical protein
MSLEIPRPLDPSLHPLVTGNCRIATPTIEAFYELVVRRLRYRITGALICGPSRTDKTRAIEYVWRLPARNYPRMTSYHAQCEHKPRHSRRFREHPIKARHSGEETSVSVVRAGEMSNGIAQVVALTGLNVVMIDMTDVALKKWEHCIRVPSARGTRQAESTHA